MTPPKRGKFPKNIPYHDVFMGTLPSSRRGKCVTLFGGVRGTPRNSSACKQQQGRYTNYCCNPYGKAAPHQYLNQYCHTHNLLQVPIAELAERWTELPQVSDESRSFFRVHTGYFSNIPKCIKAEFIASWGCSQSSVVSSSKR
ncbi:hypothetical protein TNCV_4729681 [Trichonephila clavipes]|nr:hypothetical protein TNCV_4729681 [Trichonephila clavipes]